MAAIGCRLKAILVDEFSGEKHDISGYVENVNFLYEFDGTLRAEFTLASYTSSDYSISLQDDIKSIEDVSRGSTSWVCDFCHAENIGRGDDGCCSRCGAPKGRSNAEKRI